MKRLAVELATRADDAGLRSLVSRNAVPGRMTIAYEREPDYFAGCATMGESSQVLCARDLETGEIVGVACRAERSAYVNGEPARCGYIGQLRVDERYRGRWLLSRGFRLLSDLEADRPCDVTLATMVEGSREAAGVLLDKPRRGFPLFRQVARLKTFALSTRRPRREPRDVSPATKDRIDEVERFLEARGPARQFFPVVGEGSLSGPSQPPGLDADDFLIASCGGAVRGTLAVWDQTAVKQTVVRDYRWPVRVARPLLNWAGAATGRPRLPAVDQRIRLGFASFVAVERDDPELFGSLLDAALVHARRRGLELLVVGHTDGDPLQMVTASRPHVVYESRIFTVSWEQERHHGRLDSRPIYLDPATI